MERKIFLTLEENFFNTFYYESQESKLNLISYHTKYYTEYYEYYTEYTEYYTEYTEYYTEYTEYYTEYYEYYIDIHRILR